MTGKHYGVATPALSRQRAHQAVALDFWVISVAVEAVTVVLAVIAPGAELPRSEALVDAADDRVSPA